MSLTKQEFIELVAKAGVGELTEEEATALEPYRAKNAVILAAGTCRRFEPVSFDYPKPLVEVRGEVLIERQIRQLLAAGVKDVAIVVGFMKEKFDYLVEKYGVTLIDAPDFAVTNNIVSLAMAADRLGNTYILYGDQYFTINPFKRYVFGSFYATTLTTSDDVWVMETGADGMVTDMVMSADGGEKLQGPCYVDAETGAALAVALGETLADKTNVDKTWEYAWYLHRDKLAIATRYYPEGVVNSFKSMDALRAFDDSYLLHVKSEAMDNICSILNCTYEDMYDFEPLLAGLTNYLVAFNVGDERYVYRYPLGRGGVTFNRNSEILANGIARDCGVDPTYIYEDPETGWKLSHFVKGARGLDRMNREECTPATKLLAQFHKAAEGVTVENTFSYFGLSCELENNTIARGYKMDERTMACRPGVFKIAEYIEADKFPMVLSHNDAWYANFLWGEDGRLSLIDWEFSGMADIFSDLAYHVNCYYISVPIPDVDFAREQLMIYLGREYTLEEWRHFFGIYVTVSWKVTMWVHDYFSTMDIATGWDVDAWCALTWAAMEQNSDYIISLYESEEAREAERAYMEEFFKRVEL